jgi:DNA mismatch repair protein MLH1
MLKSHSFVGLVPPNFALVQGGTRLYLLNLTGLRRAFMYETALRRFGHHPILRFGKPVPVRGLVRMAIDHPSQQQAHKLMSPEQREAQADEFTQLLVSRAAMLKEYFALEIVGGEETDTQAGAEAEAPDGASSEAMLVGIPELLEQYNPPLMVLPLFLLKLARDCNWTSEQECFESVARCIADFYSVQPAAAACPPSERIRMACADELARDFMKPGAKADAQVDFQTKGSF